MIKSKPKVTITMDQSLLDWIDVQVKAKAFGSRSHAVEKAVLAQKLAMEKAERAKSR